MSIFSKKDQAQIFEAVGREEGGGGGEKEGG